MNGRQAFFRPGSSLPPPTSLASSHGSVSHALSVHRSVCGCGRDTVPAVRASNPRLFRSPGRPTSIPTISATGARRGAHDRADTRIPDQAAIPC